MRNALESVLVCVCVAACSGTVDGSVGEPTAIADDAHDSDTRDNAHDGDPRDNADDPAPALDDEATPELGTPVDPASQPGASPSTPRPLGCATLGAVFCDDFESGALRDTTWRRLQRNDGYAAIEDTTVFEGAHAVKLHIAANAGGSTAMLIPQLQVGPSFYARFFMRVSRASEQVHSAVLSVNYDTKDASGRGRYYGLHTGFSKFVTMYYSTDLGNRDEPNQNYAQRKLPVGAWTCIEAHYDAAAGTIRVWFDGVEERGLAVSAETEPPWEEVRAIDNIQIGFASLQTATPDFDVFMDAIAFDDERLGCGK